MIGNCDEFGLNLPYLPAGRLIVLFIINRGLMGVAAQFCQISPSPRMLIWPALAMII